MSLINKMLKDLEARRKKSAEKSSEQKTPEKKPEEKIQEKVKKETLPSIQTPEKPAIKKEPAPTASNTSKPAIKNETSKTEEKPTSQKFTLDGKKTTKSAMATSPTPKSTPSKPAKKSTPPSFEKNFMPPIKKRGWLRYTSTIILLLILAAVIVALVFAAIAFHDRWQGRKKATVTKPFAQHKIVQTAKKIAAGAQAYHQQHQLTGEAKKAVSKVNPRLIKQQEVQHQAIRHQVNKMTASLIHRAKSAINIEALSKKPTSISVKKAMTPSEKAEQNYHQAMSQLNSGSTSIAIKQLQTILNTTPDYKPARIALAATLTKENKGQQAEQVLATGLKQDPNYPPYAELQAHILVQNNQVDEALTILSRAQPASISQNSNYFAFMAALYLHQGNYNQAAAYYEQLTKYNTQNANWWAGLSISLHKLGQTKKARQAYEHAKETGSLSPELAEYLSK